MNETISQDERSIREERERKKAEVRRRLEAQSSPKKKGFMTPERKKKLRSLLRRAAAEELKRQQEVEAEKRRTEIAKRVGQKYNFDSMSADELRSVCAKMHERLAKIEDTKWDIEQEVRHKDFEVREVASQVSDMRGKFVKPTLKRVPKYQQKIERMLLNARKEVGFCIPQLKAVKKEQFKVEEPKDSKELAPEWSWKKGEQKKVDGQQQQQQQQQQQEYSSQSQQQKQSRKQSQIHEDELSDGSTDEEEETVDAL